ncbi:transcription elongation factor A N-terminal and central domain-containing protein isoform X2 [Gopherus evgoodei]|uniref:Transcription elongation factor A N-terminal and central domain containing n=2 Tax=Gopherus evgoodei TaxID=1825980 RepID=A0A8C4W1W3_9SAUR|nr:transcription elongation factor A N-terminal and central domain-containing protein isoform X2 [Gopherus evgoodei]
MSDKKIIMNRAHDIEKLLSENNFQDIGNHLTEFEAVDMTIEYLQETDVAKAVYRVLQNCPAITLKKKAKHLLSKWKTLYKNNYLSSIQSKKSVSETVKEHNEYFSVVPKEQTEFSEELNQHEMLDAAGANSLLTSQNVPKDEMYNKPKSCVNQLGLLEEQRTDNEDAKPAGSETSPQQEHLKAMRLKCTKLIYKALTDSATSKEEANKWQELSREIEECIFALHARNDKKYKNCIRSKVSNLKNPKNFHLKHNLFSGTMSPKTFAEMTVMEMANDELKQLRALYTESSVQEHQLPQVIDGTQTDKIKCRRCEKFDCTVTMIARGTLFLPSWVRNANPDEQMMTYVICNECGAQWYHSRWVCL